MGELRGGASTTNEGLVDQRDRHLIWVATVRRFVRISTASAVRVSASPPVAMVDFLGYCRWLADYPHLWSTTLFDEIVALGFAGSYQAFTAALRRHELRPYCQACWRTRTRTAR